MFKKLFNIQAKTITSAAVIIGAASLVSRALGMLRDRVLAGEFGAGETLDVYYAAFRIPDLVYNLVVLGAISAGFIPVFSALLKRDKALAILPDQQKKAWEMVSNLMTLMILSLVLISAVAIVFASQIMKIIVPGFSGEQFEQVVNMTKIMFLSPILLGASAVLGGVLQTFKRFFIYSLAPILYNIGIIFGALFFVNWFGIYGLAWGVVFGALLHLLIQLSSVLNLGWRPKFIFSFKDKNTRQIFKTMTPRVMSLAVSQINLLVITIIASTLAAGSITVFNFANNLQSFPLGIFGVSFAIAAFPALSELVDKKEKFIASLSSALRQILFFIIPTSALFIILRAQIVRVVLGAGRFDWEDTVSTMDTLAFFAISLFAQGLIPLLVRAFYARQNTLTPFIIGLVAAVVNIILSLVLIKFLGVSGLALAFSISSVVQLGLLWMILHLQLENLDGLNILISVVKISGASLVMVLSVQVLKYFLEPFTGTQTFTGIFLQGAISGGIGLIFYFASCFLMKSPELLIFVSSIKKRLLKKYKPEEIISEH